MIVRVEENARHITTPHAVIAEGIVVAMRSHALDAAIHAAEERLRQADASRDSATARTRAMYRASGVDPTRTRPSSEALLRRVRRGERLPAINNLVDVVNWCSVETQVPFGLYDRQAIAGEIVVRLGHADERYEGIRKDRVNVAGRLVVADATGAFGNPTSDSARAMVTPATRGVLVVLFTPVGMPTSEVDDVIGLTKARLDLFGGAGGGQ